MKPEKQPQKPPCSEWSVWIGPEIEGTKSIGTSTVFIRSLPPTVNARSNFAFLTGKGKIKRVWFCKEFTNWDIVKAIMKLFSDVAIEVEPKNLESIPLAIRKKASIYLKVITRFKMKKGDFICVGQPFADESFELGTGVVVKPEQYLGDIKML